jgi:Tol biopolymer transport system component
MKRAIIALWLVIFVLPSMVVAQEATETPDGGLPRSEAGQLLFERNGDIYVIDGDGNNERNLTNSAEEELYAVWTQGGTKIIFAQGATLYRMNADGSEIEILVTENDSNGETRGLTISPIDDRVLWESVGSSGSPRHFMVDTTTGESETFLPEISEPVWSPDGQFLVGHAFVNQDGRASRATVVLEIATGEMTAIASGADEMFYQAWSPDGDQIVGVVGDFTSDNQHLFMITPDGKNLTPLTEGGEIIGSPAWSPDGTMIAYPSGDFLGNSYTFTRIHVLDLENHEVSEIASGIEQLSPIGLFAWSPEGQRLTFVAYDVTREALDLYVIDPNGENLQRLSEDVSLVGRTLLWRP